MPEHAIVVSSLVMDSRDPDTLATTSQPAILNEFRVLHHMPSERPWQPKR